MGPRNVREVCRNGPRHLCARGHWGILRSSRWGHETCEGCAESGPRTACELRHWDLRWSSLWGNETCEGCAKMGSVTDASAATGALGGAPI